ncbi:hypothetical protein ZRA01_17470 [Zoogloea ramigera]|uniref:Uncharacterized protein n=1 Tax=Zoogloea ramigera TaxID=350 RepID=A0A4Y4CW31_ZOORA|nr:hypothetical protein ZRA01_17470 [Zoogloea ramigera]
MHARTVAHARQKTPRDIKPQDFDHLPSQRSQRLGVHQQHPLIIEPDAPIAGREAKPREQISQIRETHLVVLNLSRINDRQAIT